MRTRTVLLARRSHGHAGIVACMPQCQRVHIAINCCVHSLDMSLDGTQHIHIWLQLTHGDRGQRTTPGPLCCAIRPQPWNQCCHAHYAAAYAWLRPGVNVHFDVVVHRASIALRLADRGSEDGRGRVPLTHRSIAQPSALHTRASPCFNVSPHTTILPCDLGRSL
jgi:hypothetical protein